MSIGDPRSARDDRRRDARHAWTRSVEPRAASRRCARRARDGVARRGRSARRSRVPAASNVIAECKRRSPSRGVLRRDYDPAAHRAPYEAAGAAAISVLTEPTFFDGSLEHLRGRARRRRPAAAAQGLHRRRTTRSRGARGRRRRGAADRRRRSTTRSCAALQRDARALGLDALVEVHDEDELARALAAGADIIGVNSRNLRTLAVDVACVAAAGARCIPADVIAVAESGLQIGATICGGCASAGYRAFLDRASAS